MGLQYTFRKMTPSILSMIASSTHGKNDLDVINHQAKSAWNGINAGDAALLLIGFIFLCAVSMCLGSTCYACFVFYKKKEWDPDMIGGRNRALSIRDFQSERTEIPLNDIDDDESDENISYYE